MLQELCPRCGADWLDDSRACPACGFDRIGPRAPAGDDSRSGIKVRSMGLALVTLATVALVIVAFGAGVRLGSLNGASDGPEIPAANAGEVPASGLGRVRFAERLGDSLELESYRTQFRASDTIAWRAEFLQPPPTNELTVIIAWQSIRERMQLSETTVTLRDTGLTMIGSDEVALADLVPTAGLYAVSYYGGDTKLAEGVFELLPPEP